MILPDRTIYLFHPTRTSARTVVVSLLTLAAPHLPLITRENPPLPTHLRPRSSLLRMVRQTLSLSPYPDLEEIPIEYP
jgi:hypothetical protein